MILKRSCNVSRLLPLSVLLMLCTLFLPEVYGTTSTEKLWSSSTLTGNYGDLLYTVEPQIRLIVADNPYNQFLVNAGGGYKVSSNWELWLGGTETTTSQDAVGNDLEEYRAWEQVVWKKQIHDFKLTSRTRFEQRRSVNFADWANRARERLLVNIPIASNLSFVLSDEVLINLNHVRWIMTNTFDQNRAYVGLVQQVSNTVYLGAGYMNQFISTQVQQVDNVLAINIHVDLSVS